MHWLDFVLVLALVLGGLLGLRSGLLWQVARLIIFGVAIYACIHHHARVANWLEGTFDGLTNATSWLMAYIVTFLAVCLAGFFVTYFLEYMLQAARLKPIDRFFGAIVGVLKTALLAGGILTGMAVYGDPETRESMAGSRLAPPLLECMQWFIGAVPQEFKDELNDKIHQIKDQASDKFRERDEKKPPPAIELRR